MYTNDTVGSRICIESKAIREKREYSYKDFYKLLCEEIFKYTDEIKDSNFIIQYPKLAKSKNDIYPTLEKLLKQCDMIKDDKLKLSKIKIIYNWFMDKKKNLNNLENKNSVKEQFKRVEFPLGKENKLNEIVNLIESKENKQNNELKENIYDNKKKNDIKVKRILPPIRKDDEVKNLNSFNTNENNIDAATKSFLNKLSPSNSTNQVTQNTTNYDSYSFKDLKKFRKIINLKSLEKDKLSLVTDVNSKQSSKELNKQISDKRNLNVLNAYMDEWSYTNTKFIRKIDRSQEISQPYNKDKKNAFIPNISNDNKRVNLKVTKGDKSKKLKIVSNKISKNKKLITKKIKITSKTIDICPDKKDNNVTKVSSNKAVCLEDIISSETILINQEEIKKEEKFNKKKGKYLIIKPTILHGSPVRKNTDDDRKLKRSVSVNFKEFNPEKNNMLKKREMLKTFTTFEILKLKTDLFKENISIPFKTLKRAFISPESKNYPKHYLPKAGYGLMSNPLLQYKKLVIFNN